MRLKTCGLILLILGLWAGLATQQAAAYNYTIHVGSARPNMTFEGVGWTVMPADLMNGGWNQQEPLIAYGQHDMWRIAVWPNLWEPQNDNTGAWSWSGFNFNTPFMTRLIDLIQYAENNGIEVEIANWSCGGMQPGDPSWLGTGGVSCGHPTNETEFAEALCAMVYHLKVTNGLSNITRLSLWNEPSNPSFYAGTYPTQFSRLYKVVHEYFAAFGLRNGLELVICDDHDYHRQHLPTTLNTYVDGWWSVDGGTDAVSMHHYGLDSSWITDCLNSISTNNPDNTIEPLYLYELGGYTLPANPTTADQYRYGIEQASATIDAINLGAKLAAYWVWNGGGGGYGATAMYSCGTQIEPVMYYPSALMTRAIDKNSQVCWTTIAGNASYVRATKLLENNERTVLITNDNVGNHGTTYIGVYFDDLPAGTTHMYGYYVDYQNWGGLSYLGEWDVTQADSDIWITAPNESIIVMCEHAL